MNSDAAQGGAEADVVLVPYDPAWPREFERERALLAPVLGDWISGTIEHVGSTAVPGLLAKPIIDIMVGVRDLPSSLAARDALASLDYHYFPYRPDVMHWFCKPSPTHRTHHLHLVPFDSRLWRERLAFRDFLRGSPDARQRYAALKVSSAERFRTDREAYTDAKGRFVHDIVERALNAPHCIFCDIIACRAPASIVYRDEHSMAFMDVRPVNAGHLLVVPVRHAADLAELDPAVGAHLFRVAHSLAAAVRRSGLRADGVNFLLADGAAAGQEVPHAHLHVFPRLAGDGFGFAFPPGHGQPVERARLDRDAAAIRAALGPPDPTA